MPTKFNADPYGNILSLTTAGSTVNTPTSGSTNRLSSTCVNGLSLGLAL